LLKKAGVLKNGKKLGKTGKKRAKNGDCPHLMWGYPLFIQSAGLINQTPT